MDHRAKPGDQDGIVAADADFFQSLINGTESAGNLGSIKESERIRKKNQILLFCEQILGHTAVTLPAVSPAVLRAGAGNHVPAAAIIAHSAAGDVVNQYAVAGFEPATPGTGLYDKAGRFMSGDHSLVSLWTLAKVFMIDTTDIGPADGGCFYLKQHLTVPRSGYGNIPDFDAAVPG